jgi:prevent-host-death family protein
MVDKRRDTMTTTRRGMPVTYRNRRGEDRRVASFNATDAKNSFGRMLEATLREGAVVITKHDDPKAVLLSWEEFEALTSARTGRLTALTGEFDALMARMQTATAREGMRTAFDAPPAKLGKAAVAAARRRG